MHKKTIIYRGNLKSCNYRCSYCPFSKHKLSPAELEKDLQNFTRFCGSIERRVQKFSIGAVFVAPYGEASIHSWYWEGLARVAKLPGIDRVGMQTNLSFSIEECLKIYDSGLEGNVFQREKLYIWATFHPEMTDIDQFVSKCYKLTEKNVNVCAGAVGVPGNIRLLRELREKLSPAVYLWINKMDGLGRNYTEEELKAFAEIDSFFVYELWNPAADAQMCKDRCFVEADGKIHSCNISRAKEANWYDGTEEEIFEPLCSAKRCSCYLAYGGRADFGLKNIFGQYSLFRIPRKFKAVFFDLEGTLIGTTGKGHEKRALSEKACEMLAALKEMCPVFLATSMPAEEARKRLKGKIDLFQGGIFASGAYLYLKKGNEILQKVYPISIPNLPEITEYAKASKARLKIYRKNDAIYKITIIKEHSSVWNSMEQDRMADFFDKSYCRIFTEKNCLEAIDKNRNKGTGIEEMCKWLGISPKDVLAFGNDREDMAMEKVCGAYVKR